ncbi:hypothetical protein DEFDS_P252 (plasmid) [Deferribacter desulfuricans SSM1]|uniref:Uncharacterized protein n=1 Tax=Deferribacter desulfuricans (strain DSM 14783 / JCM 11476 / NBRC 101012 / SSM1) TaxID=639282 RepID=D3PF80_DEFDS|nr:hypothetical protein [Deferribacter desulfuricans]BAI81872.1 hypothetical protein DEFDS_P252 [Deferribacter desulfuricans SSM1]
MNYKIINHSINTKPSKINIVAEDRKSFFDLLNKYMTDYLDYLIQNINNKNNKFKPIQLPIQQYTFYIQREPDNVKSVETYYNNIQNCTITLVLNYPEIHQVAFTPEIDIIKNITFKYHKKQIKNKWLNIIKKYIKTNNIKLNTLLYKEIKNNLLIINNSFFIIKNL